MPLTQKQLEFNKAMELYESRPSYSWIGWSVSVANVGLQTGLLIFAWQHPIGLITFVWVLFAAFLIADFVNGMVHMIMDNNDQYASKAGPLVAAFHLHHHTPAYKPNPLWYIYFHETGSKVWLVGFLLFSFLMVWVFQVPAWGIHLLAYCGILSSIAEVSHYGCHVPDTQVRRFLGKTGLLLDKKHHMIHHIQDNVHYAFLNGWTDPLLNRIAKKYFPGYKNTTDLHYAAYEGKGTSNRG